jgi:hypothetical protein
MVSHPQPSVKLCSLQSVGERPLNSTIKKGGGSPSERRHIKPKQFVSYKRRHGEEAVRQFSKVDYVSGKTSLAFFRVDLFTFIVRRAKDWLRR